MTRRPIPQDLKAVFLDAGGVLIVPDLDVIDDGAALPDALTFDSMYEAFAKAMNEQVSPSSTDATHNRAIWKGFLENLGEATDTPDRVKFLNRIEERSIDPWYPVTPAPGVAPALQRLSDANIPMVVVSNAEGSIERELREGGVCQVEIGEGTRVAAVIDSEVVGIRKPSPGIFKIALDVVGATASEVVHVGDSVGADMVGAEAAGIAAIHIDRINACTDESHWHATDIPAAVALILNPPAA